MPYIPIYNQGATEEAGLTRAKRRVIKAMESGIVKLTEKPEQDLTNGKADDIANLLIGYFEDLTSLFRQIISYFGSSEDVVYLETSADAVKALKSVILTARAVGRVLRTAKVLAPIMRYLDLGILSDLKAAQAECDEAGVLAFGVLFNINFEELDADFESIGNIQDEDLDEEDAESVASSITLPSRASSQPKQRRIDSMFQQLNRAAKQLQEADSGDDASSVSSTGSTGSRSTSSSVRKRRETLQLFSRLGVDTYEKIVTLIHEKYNRAIEILENAYSNFNEFRQQKLLPAETKDVIEEIKTGSGMPYAIRKPIYSIGNAAMNALYEIDGLPRFI